MKKRIIVYIICGLLFFCSCSTPLSVERVEYTQVKIDLTDTLDYLEKTKPDRVPDFPEPIKPGATDTENYLYLGNVISAYQASLEAWQNHSEAQAALLKRISEELK